MKNGELPEGRARGKVGSEASQGGRRYSVLVELSHEQMAAAEGWRAAHGISDQAEAFGELIRLGLLSEIAKIYRMVCKDRDTQRSTRS